MAGIERFHVGPRFCEATVANGVVYLAGQVADQNPEADIEGQTKEVLGHIDRLLAECGSSKEHLLTVQIFMTDIKEISRMNAVWEAWVVKGQTPPRATVQAALADPRYKIEITATALKVAKN